MNIKRYFLAAIAVFIGSLVLDFVIHNLLLAAEYQATASVWRPDMEDKMWLMPVISFFWSFLLAYIFFYISILFDSNLYIAFF